MYKMAHIHHFLENIILHFSSCVNLTFWRISFDSLEIITIFT